jgi:hypothetical protein
LGGEKQEDEIGASEAKRRMAQEGERKRKEGKTICDKRATRGLQRVTRH